MGNLEEITNEAILNYIEEALDEGTITGEGVEEIATFVTDFFSEQRTPDRLSIISDRFKELTPMIESYEKIS